MPKNSFFKIFLETTFSVRLIHASQFVASTLYGRPCVSDGIVRTLLNSIFRQQYKNISTRTKSGVAATESYYLSELRQKCILGCSRVDSRQRLSYDTRRKCLPSKGTEASNVTIRTKPMQADRRMGGRTERGFSYSSAVVPLLYKNVNGSAFVGQKEPCFSSLQSCGGLFFDSQRHSPLAVPIVVVPHAARPAWHGALRRNGNCFSYGHINIG